MDKDQISIQVTVLADSKKIWNYWNTPEDIKEWNFASDDWHCPYAENDLKVGGKIKSRMEAKDGSFGFDFEGIYSEIIPQRKIVYSMSDGRKVATTFEGKDGETKITTTFDAEKENSLEMQRNGWQAILDNFKKYVETKR